MKKNTILQGSWIWNDTVSSFVEKNIVGYSLNVCAGKSKLGDVRLDLDPQDRSIIRGDMRALPFKSNLFDTVIEDPPWKISYYERFRPFFECVRVCKVGGLIIYNAYWIPMTPSGDAKRIKTVIRQDNDFTNTSIISVFRKVRANPSYETIIEKELGI